MPGIHVSLRAHASLRAHPSLLSHTHCRASDAIASANWEPKFVIVCSIKPHEILQCAHALSEQGASQCQ